MEFENTETSTETYGVNTSNFKNAALMGAAAGLSVGFATVVGMAAGHVVERGVAAIGRGITGLFEKKDKGSEDGGKAKTKSKADDKKSDA